jgi:VanZ family protein
MTTARARLRPWLPALLYMALTFVVSSFRVDMPEVGRFPLADKAIHAVEYAILGFLCARASLATWPDRPRLRVALVGALIAAAWGLGDEIHQVFVPGRVGEAADLLADAVGATVGALVCARFSRSRRLWGTPG